MENLKRILDENNSPVARMRLFSTGINTNNRILQYEPITGDKACLACGNCVDACPVVREKRRFVFTQNQRTSMSLENIVGLDCRRCYACVRACPQVSKPTKEYALGFRRGEKFVHAYTATLIILLAMTGILTYHFKEFMPGWQQAIMKLSHTLAGFCLLAAPLLYYLLDRHHFQRMLKNIFVFGEADLAWLRDFWEFLKHPKGKTLPDWKEFNTYHKFWAAYLLTVVPVLGLTGIINLLGEGTVGWVIAGISLSLHAFLALMTDLLVITHLYFKLLRSIIRNTVDMGVSYKQSGHLHFPFLYDPKSR